MRKDETAASRIVSGERGATLDQWCALIDLCDLKLVDRERVCVDRKAYEALTYLAQKAMANQEVAKALIWEDD